jgi:hypothetical protein
VYICIMENGNNINISIYTHRELVIEASTFINENRKSSYMGVKGNNSYYNINGVVWEVWQDACGNYPTSEGILVENFKLNQTGL